MMGSNEDHKAMMKDLVGPYDKLYYKSPEFHAWVHMQAALIIEQRELVARAFEAQLRERNEEAHEIMTDARPRLFANDNGKLKTWVVEPEGIPHA